MTATSPSRTCPAPLLPGDGPGTVRSRSCSTTTLTRAEQGAHADLGYVAERAAVEDRAETVVMGTVLGEAVFSALRRLAHVHTSARQFGDRADAGKDPG
ncbi:hypothetical protein OG453_43820 [Streptomyces sp. NBC_01381]|uniref:hypothetical protein n=1 Tax=Streptomyces sp. NBC_01381 TaxID=2903845 RepID=UPI002252AB46|nr:hypothetical protein [Streptomyces sp. NBC_01381]MCX4673492.1 hypothetical protein [Streptomyces sp. NBC_01381]